MQKIDKSNIRSSVYKVWVEGLSGNHPKYDSGQMHVKDIKMSLLACQNGLCAYTEELLCDRELLTDNKWKDGKYIGDLSNQNLVNGDLEHFDCTLKNTQGYLWDNLFMANSNINCRVKGTKPIDNILKPDCDTYDPNVYLQFDDKVNAFIANQDLPPDEKAKVEEMITVLGINSNAFKRAKQIKDLKENIELGLPLSEPDEYITSWKMTKDNLESSE